MNKDYCAIGVLQMKFVYDEEADVLYAFLEGSKPGRFDEIGEGVWMRRDPITGRSIGFTILDYRRRKKAGKIVPVPDFPNIEIPY